MKEASRIATHCVKYALSDPKDEKFRANCDHQHDLTCDRCILTNAVLNGIATQQSLIYAEKQQIATSNELAKLAQTSRDINDAIIKINDMLHHQIRVAWNENHRHDLIANMNYGTAVITLDWAMKFLPMRSRETQKDFYGQRGISYHITHVMIKLDIDNDNDPEIDEQYFVQRTFVHIFDSEYQVIKRSQIRESQFYRILWPSSQYCGMLWNSSISLILVVL